VFEYVALDFTFPLYNTVLKPLNDESTFFNPPLNLTTCNDLSALLRLVNLPFNSNLTPLVFLYLIELKIELCIFSVVLFSLINVVRLVFFICEVTLKSLYLLIKASDVDSSTFFSLTIGI
jgi:hypothetical protein